MSSLAGVINGLVDEKLLNMSTAFVAKVIRYNSSKRTATLQPLGKVKAYGKEAKNRAVLTDVPVCRNVFKVGVKEVFVYSRVDGSHYRETIPYVVDVASGDLVVCVVCDRDISQAVKGNNAIPTLGHHEIIGRY